MSTESIFMREDLEEQLRQRFPWLEQRNSENGDASAEIVFFPVGVGWFNLLSDMFEEIETLYKSLNEPLENISFYEIKEKYGGLRVDMNHTVKGLYEIIGKYEDLSYQVCERCGEIGELREDRAWHVVLCDKCDTQG